MGTNSEERNEISPLVKKAMEKGFVVDTSNPGTSEKDRFGWRFLNLRGKSNGRILRIRYRSELEISLSFNSSYSNRWPVDFEEALEILDRYA